MEFRIEKRTIACISGLLLAPVLMGQQSFQYGVRQAQSRQSMGTLTIGATGVSFEQTYGNGKKPRRPRAWHWEYEDIQQLKISPRSLSVLTYADNKWKLGADREYRFDLVSDGSFESAYQVLKARLDQRLVAVIAEIPAGVLWEMPAKHLAGFGGDEGLLRVGTGEIVYQSARRCASRTWRYEDIDNISSAGPFELTITSYERAKLDYGSRKQFAFSLKQRLEEDRYNDLWLRLNQAKGLQALTAYRADTSKR